MTHDLSETYAAARDAVAKKTKGGATGTYASLLARVKEEGLLERRSGFYVRRVALILTLLTGVLVSLGFTDSWLLVIPAGLALGVLTTQLAFVGHEAAHRQVFDSAKANSWAALLLADVGAGMSIGWWTTKHTRHHGAPNQVGKDGDIDMKVLALTKDQVEERSRLGQLLARVQGWFFFALLPFSAFSFIAASYAALLDRNRKIEHRAVELTALTARLVGFPVLALVLLPWPQAIVLVLIQVTVLGFYMGATFALNHMGMPILPHGSRIDFLSRQVLTSRNISGGRFMSTLMGGLNHQVEHHLFPSMPRPHLRRAAELVREHCHRERIPYYQANVRESYVLVVRYLNRVGIRNSDPLQCPVASRLRLAQPAL